MVSPWQRHLLMWTGAVEEEGAGLAAGLTPETAVVAVAVLLLMVMVLVLCTCGDEGSTKKQAKSSARNSNGAKASHAVADGAAVGMDTMVEGELTHLTVATGEAALSNGVSNGGRCGSSPSSHSRQESSGSGQMRPTSLRELPDLPGSHHKRNHSGAGVVDKPAATARGSNAEDAADSNAYDHLGAKIPSKSAAAVNYDHINLESPRDVSAGTTPASEPDTASEGHYAQVRERTYDVVKDVRSRASAKVTAATDYDPYAKVKDVDEDDKEDPYSKVKDSEKDNPEDDYAHLKHDHVLPTPPPDLVTTTTVTIDDEDDPYEKVIGDSGGGRFIPDSGVGGSGGGNEGDPDDLYSVVSEQPNATPTPTPTTTTSGLPTTTTTTSSPPPRMGVQIPKTAPPPPPNSAGGGAGVGVISAGLSADDSLRLQFADEEDGDPQDDYATVVKDRGSVAVGGGGGGGGGATTTTEGAEPGGEEGEEIEPYFTTSPPEPPRMYGASEVGVGGGGGGEGAVASSSLPLPCGSPGDGAAARHEGKPEHRYTKVTARESLASMTARNALNAYEFMPDMPENTYATVEGGSGDGVVRYSTPGTPNLQHSASQLSETYAEIGASGGYAVPAPEPPSLSSLHSMTQSTDNHPHSPRPPPSPLSSSHPNVLIAEDGYAVVSKATGFSPSETALPRIPGVLGSSGSVGSFGEEVMLNGVLLHPDYDSVKDSIADADNENDPNYESVDEALSKAPLTSSQPSSSSSTSGSNPSSARGVATTSSSAAVGAHSPQLRATEHGSPSRRRHQYEEVSPPASPLVSTVTHVSTIAVTAAAASASASSSSNGLSSNSASSSGAVPREAGGDAVAAVVRDRVLQGHMYEAIAEVKTKKNASAAARQNASAAARQNASAAKQNTSAARQGDSGKKRSSVAHNVTKL